MLRKNNAIIVFFTFVILFTLGALASAEEKTEQSPQNFITIGKEDAPINMEVFLIVTCQHCAKFANIALPQIVQNYVDKGKVKLTIYHAPLDQISFHFSTLLFCQDSPYQFDLLKIVTANQKSLLDPDTINQFQDKINRYFQLAGFTKEKINACIADLPRQTEVRAFYFNLLKKHNITTYPYILINGEAVGEIPEYENIKNKLDSL